MEKKSIKVVIPARYNSTRLPGKPLLDLLGVPMIVRVYQNIKKALPNVEIIVAIDDLRVEKALIDRSIPYVMTSIDHVSGTDRIYEVAQALSFNDEDIIINVQGDEPLIPNKLLLSFLDYCIQLQEELDMATVCTSFSSLAQLEDPNSVKVTLDKFSSALYFSRSIIPFQRDIETLSVENYKKHVGIYAYRCSSLKTLTSNAECSLERLEKLEQLRALWLGIKIHVMNWHGQVPKGVDSPKDAELVRGLLLKST